MNLLTTLLSCLLSLFGCAQASTTSITRVVDDGDETLFSKTTLADGVATFECFTSASGAATTGSTRSAARPPRAPWPLRRRRPAHAGSRPWIRSRSPSAIVARSKDCRRDSAIA
ncbi:hypothetical protein H1235_02295 [Pseudoxanthomonas sp. NC8]|nr:hypothetical protein H1235_02295 [Pseudoxanthomonas sp. NC8]